MTFVVIIIDECQCEVTMQGVQIEQLLGGTEVIGHKIRNEMDLYEVSKTGLPKKALINLIQNLGFSVKAMASLLSITERTIQRKSDTELLDFITSEQILQVADVYSRGNTVFGSQEKFKDWIMLTNKALNNMRPIDLLSSRYGAQMVLDEIGRIEYGIIA
jgi:putative toxin-antitoxin system antitoxin component (TIGR02293 family)